MDRMLSVVATEQAPFQNDKRKRLQEIIAAESVRKGEAFELASGGTSNIYFNMKETMLHPEGANLVAELMLEILAQEQVDSIGGLEMGAVPLVSALCVKSHPDHPIKAFFVRKATKQHGTKQQIEGHLQDGSNVIIFDDVTTTGSSVLEAVKAVRDRRCRVGKAIAIVDRLEGAERNLRKEGIELVALFRKRDFEST